MKRQHLFTHLSMTEGRVQFAVFEKLEIIDHLLTTS